MTDRSGDWRPDPALLSAYLDGELIGRPELVALRDRIEVWLRDHPEARAEFADHRQIDELWRETTPPAPSDQAWAKLEAALAAARPQPWFPSGHAAAALLAAAAAITILVWWTLSPRAQPEFVQQPNPPAPAPVAEIEVFPVAAASEITILSVEGADTQTVVVGVLPVLGVLELAGPGEVALTSVQPDVRDRMVPHIRLGNNQRPMIWAPVDAEASDP